RTYLRWALLVAGIRTLAQVYLRHEQQDQVIKTFGEISEIMRQRDDFWTEDANEGGQYALQNVSNLDPVGQNSTVSEGMPAFKAENLREEWFSKWVITAQIGFGKEFKDFSVALGPQLARGLLQDWLLHKAGYNETKRHVLLGRLQTERLDSFIPIPRNSEILQEAEKMLDLVSTLCDEAQQKFKRGTMNWRNIACLAKKELQAQQNPEALWNEELPEFREVPDMYKVSLQESRDRGSLLNEAATLLFIAQHYITAPCFFGPMQ
ncbi:MAG: hypothetical protein Q9210_006968, partial [Variospora velana]